MNILEQTARQSYSVIKVSARVAEKQVSLSFYQLGLELDGDRNFSSEVVEELSDDELSDRHRLELRVERVFYEAGTALRELRDRKLYRDTHRTFEDYCKNRFGYHRRHCYQLIDAADVVENLCANSAQKKSGTSGAHILPTNEYQVRPLTKLEPAQQIMIWQQAVESAGGKAPSGRIVKSIVEQLKERPLRYATEFCAVGDVFTLTQLEGEERRYNCYPCVAVDLNEFTVKVDVCNTTIAVKPENLKSVDSPDVVHQFPIVLRRIRRLWQCELDRGATSVLEALSKQTYLTDLEEKLLTFLEREYKIDTET
ncbi:hypothetical protein [Aliterella atlantica]|uniref:hypothetical protein n=1 Tax=Aliterella atlantica TaxID=1827278 RepID=UPI000695E875|nr:hypothetical protein [Aliterella atlantica]